MLQLIDLTRTFTVGPHATTPIHQLDLQLDPSEWLTVLAPSGSGKTTLFRLITGQLRPSTGDVVLSGERLSRIHDRQLWSFRARRLGVILERENLVSVLTVRENIELPLRVRRIDRRERYRLAVRALDLVQGLDWFHRRASRLNALQAQLVALARAVVTDPDLVLLDEPTGRLDSHATEFFMARMTDVYNALGVTTLLLSHDPRTALAATQVRQLSAGKLIMLSAATDTPP